MSIPLKERDQRGEASAVLDRAHSKALAAMSAKRERRARAKSKTGGAHQDKANDNKYVESNKNRPQQSISHDSNDFF